MYFLSSFNAYKLKNQIFRDIMLRRMVNRYRRFVVPSSSKLSPSRVYSTCFCSWDDMAAMCSTLWQLSLPEHHFSPYCLRTHDRSEAGKSSGPRCHDARLLPTARTGICLTGPIGRYCARALVIFKIKQCDTTQSCRTGFIFKIVEVHGRFHRTKQRKM